MYKYIYIYIYIYIPFHIPYKIFKNMFEQGGGEILSALFFVWLFESCKFHYLPQMATHALGHMIYGYTLLVPMNIYNFIEE